MHEMTVWELILNNPAWVGAISSSVFAAVTIAVVVWQICVIKTQARIMATQAKIYRKQTVVMRQQLLTTKEQGRIAAAHERTQINLIRLQFEQEMLLRLNAERDEMRKLILELHAAIGCLSKEGRATDKDFWDKAVDLSIKLRERLSVLTLNVHMGQYDGWFLRTDDYQEAVADAVANEVKMDKLYGESTIPPHKSTRNALKAADET